MPELSLVIPAYNEAAGIAEAIAEADAALAGLGRSYEIVIVDDGSADDTFEVAQAAAANRPAVRVLRHERNRGYGAALRTAEGAPAGTVTSGGYGPTLEAPIAMGYVPAALAEPGQPLLADVRGADVPVTVAPLPFAPHRYVRGAK